MFMFDDNEFGVKVITGLLFTCVSMISAMCLYLIVTHFAAFLQFLLFVVVMSMASILAMFVLYTIGLIFIKVLEKFGVYL